MVGKERRRSESRSVRVSTATTRSTAGSACSTRTCFDPQYPHPRTATLIVPRVSRGIGPPSSRLPSYGRLLRHRQHGRLLPSRPSSREQTGPPARERPTARLEQHRPQHPAPGTGELLAGRHHLVTPRAPAVTNDQPPVACSGPCVSV